MAKKHGRCDRSFSINVNCNRSRCGRRLARKLYRPLQLERTRGPKADAVVCRLLADSGARAVKLIATRDEPMARGTVIDEPLWLGYPR
jgi:hypothetical protein